VKEALDLGAFFVESKNYAKNDFLIIFSKKNDLTSFL